MCNWLALWWFAPILSAHGGASDDRMHEIVGLYRDALVLADAADGLPEPQRQQIGIVGKMLFDERRSALGALWRELEADLPRAKPDRASEIRAFLSSLESDPELHDADKLAFLDLILELRTALAAAPAGKQRDALLRRVKEDEAVLREIEERYRAEVRALLGRLGTRGMKASRELWEAYLEQIRADRSVEDIFERHGGSPPQAASATRGLKDNALELYGTSLPDKTFVITFDDGPSEQFTPQVLDILEAHGVHGIFFEVGDNVASVEGETIVASTAADQTHRVLADGHLLGNHSWSHKNLPKTSDAELAKQLDLADRVLDEVSRTDVRLFRPPYGGRDGRVLDALQARDTRAFLWNVDSMDWADPIPESIASTVQRQVTANGRGVILLHDVHHQTVEALPLILDQLAADGYRLVLWDGESVLGPDVPLANAVPEPEGDAWAVVVGVDRYDHWPRLSYAVRDARGVRDKLIGDFGFRADRVIGLFDGEATRERILEVLGDELPAKVGPEDSVFVFFAGHGATRQTPGGDRGYIVPVDADTEHLQSRAIPMTTLDDIHEALPARHVLFVMDACYSGIALTRSGGYGGDPRRYLREVTRRASRQILTAGGADEQVSDSGPQGHSVFTWSLLQGLDGPADLNGDGAITASELAGFVSPRVSSMSKQTPLFGNLVGSEGGEFVLDLGGERALLSELSGGEQSEAELARARSLLVENAELQEELARMRKTLASLERSRGLAGTDPAAEAQTLHRYGLDQFRKGKLAEAYEAIRQAAELDGDDVEIVNNMGYMLQRLGAHDRALPWLQRAIALDPERAVAYLNLGDSYRALDRREEAEAAYRRYLEMVPGSPARARIETWLAER